ncbi:hypothetical protein ASPACDRAFT_39194 [Aspergillus aculeatus ATCC 16872]|uniref:Uncharacterized protein n=1 Tax=Aspergillus aculeatus (strain ATCC 16872 / CBS 172.66 / WB 5094) TaxID=690307 RepID=A0A1L9X550_ASPA1|nr:uncharacterized protein ASPACDRAFT_39194 [Aspergillus aculeatus ATCC 16872]OJK03577.1 hypothetical protein ASPACDRAFT_39194 [Aspergillus aculeatus ATCC 16872]
MADYCFGEMSARAHVQIFDVDSTSGGSDAEDELGIYEGDHWGTPSESEVDSDFDDRDESPPSPLAPKFPRDGEELLHDVASLLDGKGIGNVLVGEVALSIMGVPIAAHYTAFMIPDGQIDQAAQVLRDAQYPDCKDLDQFAAKPTKTKSRIRCRALTGGATRRCPIPVHHFHTDHRYPEDRNDSRNQTRGVFLYCASQMLAPGFPMPAAGPPPPEDPFYMVTSDARLYRPSLRGEDGLVMLNCRGRQSTESYPVKILHPARYMENLVYLMVRDIGYLVCNGWQTEFKCMLTFSPLLPAANLALAAIDVELGDVQAGPIRDWIGLHHVWDNNEAAICVRFAALHRYWKKSGLLGEPLMTPREAKGVSPKHIEDCLRNMEEGKPPSLDRSFEESDWTCQLM